METENLISFHATTSNHIHVHDCLHFRTKSQLHLAKNMEDRVYMF